MREFDVYDQGVNTDDPAPLDYSAVKKNLKKLSLQNFSSDKTFTVEIVCHNGATFTWKCTESAGLNSRTYPDIATLTINNSGGAEYGFILEELI